MTNNYHHWRDGIKSGFRVSLNLNCEAKNLKRCDTHMRVNTFVLAHIPETLNILMCADSSTDPKHSKDFVKKIIRCQMSNIICLMSHVTCLIKTNFFLYPK